MARSEPDLYADLFAARTKGMSASEVRALFAVASRPEVISLAGGMPYVRALSTEAVLSAARRVIEERADVALQYGSGQGHPGLRDQLVRIMAAEGIEADPDHLVVTDGAQQGLDLVAKLFIDPGDQIVIEAPAYVGALSAFSTYEPTYVSVALDDDGMVVERLEEALDHGARPKFVYTVPNFHNPAGVTLSYERRLRLVEVCREAGIPILEDNPYGMLRFEGEAVPALRTLDPENVIYLGTVSKVFAPGVRVGWVLAAPEVLAKLILAKEAANLCSSHFTQLLTEEYFAHEDWRSGLASFVEVYRGRRNAMLDALAEHFPSDATWTHPHGGFYVWATVPSSFDTSRLLAAAVERRVAYVPGTAFYPGDEGRDRMRLSFCYPPEDAIREGVRRLGALLTDELAAP